MSRLLTGLLVVALATIAPAQALAQAATGTIRGKITNATNAASLENVVLTIVETKQQVTSNAYGEYVLRNVPAGEVTLRAAYVGEPDQLAKLTVSAGGELTQDFLFRESAETKRNDDGTIILNPFVVESERYNNARAIATAEERNAINIKNVVSIEEFGYIPSGNVGEFTKFLPGILLDYGSSNGNNQGFSENSASGISVRGFGPEDTAILIDGLPVSSTIPGNLTRQTGLDQLSITNASRVELIKVATPDMPANSIGGQVNLVTRNAFEQRKPSYSARLFFNFNTQNDDFLEKTPGPTRKHTFKTTPGLDLSASYPLGKNLGFSLSLMAQQEYSESWRAQSTYNNDYAANYHTGSIVSSTNGQATSAQKPILTRYQITNSAALTDRMSGNFKVDWKPTPNQTLRANVQYSTYATDEAQRRLDFRPAIVNNTNWEGDASKTIGASTSNGATAMTVTTRDRLGDTVSGQLQYDLDVAGFNIKLAGSYSQSVGTFDDTANGHYSEVAFNLNPSRVSLLGIENGIPSVVENYWRASGTNTTSTPKDYTIFSNWSADGTTAKSGSSRNERNIALAKIDIERSLDFLPGINGHNITIKAGARRDVDENIKSGLGTGYYQILKTGASYPLADMIDTNYIGISPGFGLAPQQWGSTYKLYEYNQANDIFFEPTTGADAVNIYNSYANQQKDLKETRDAYYAMLTARFLDNRLTIVGGMRQENFRRKGRAPFIDNKWNYVKNKDGSLYKDAANPNGVTTNSATSTLFANTAAGQSLRAALTSAGIAFPTTPYGATNTDIAARKLQLIPLREVDVKTDGDPSYSVNALYRLTDKIDVKAAWSRAFKLPLLESGTGGIISGSNNFTITEYTETEQSNNNGYRGQIQMANPSLKPEISNQWDFETSYHTSTGGKYSVSYYIKQVTNQSMDFVMSSGDAAFDVIIESLGLDPSQYQDWRLVTSTNSSSEQKTSGVELTVQQDLRFLGHWGRRISTFATWSVRSWPPPAAVEPITVTRPDGTTVTSTPNVSRVTLRSKRSGSAGVQYSGDRLSVQVRGVYRSEREDSGGRLVRGDRIFQLIEPEETRIDLNVSYALNKTYSLFLSGRDIFNAEREKYYRDSYGELAGYGTPRDLRKFGVSWTVGVSGSW